MNTDQYKKELLYRKANGKRLAEDYVYKVVSLFTVDENSLVFMGLKETDEVLSSSCGAKVKEEKIKVLQHELGDFLKELKNDDSSYYVFIDEDWKYCGSFIISSLCLLNENFSFGKKIINDILFISTDFKKSISLDYYELNGDFFIDITTSISM
ncbi:hypothetical protein [Candidatus Pantoea multigeneris]|uniref:Uncharacterized protein n=1 Tax=Candidatus Pantoea multigeneris TaxID=2608357 RepID=A0ABX0RFQ6_9GAMM|nr:hypothetical protein [Pantoea multigeneris]NIF23096.1 hypothetical protein [Pantoea multigeneris]